MSHALDKVIAPIRPSVPSVAETGCRLNISVVFTSVPSTIAALKRAATLVSGLAARITLLVPQVVPYPLPLNDPHIALHWNEQRFQAFATESPLDTDVHLIYCRDSIQALRQALSLRSIVVIGCARSWWPFTREKRLIRALQMAGHNVVYTEKE